jgi:hypothetical protein
VADRHDTAAHAAHDLLLVAALADRELRGPEHDRARAQVDACAECARLHAELLSLARATHALPPVNRPRDFTLRPEDAQRLRPNLLRRIFGSFGTARDGFSRPLAVGLTTLGLAGILVGAVPGALSLAGAGAGSAPAEADRLHTISAAPGATAPAYEYANPAPASSSGLAGQGDGRDTGQIADEGSEDPSVALAPDSTGMSLPIVLSGTLLIAGLGLFALRWTSRRFGG